MTTLIEILLPLYDNEGRPFGRQALGAVRSELIERFGGLTAFTRAPAEGLWEADGETARDDVIVLQVMTDELDADWWRAYREGLERRFRQDSVVVRAQEVRLL